MSRRHWTAEDDEAERRYFINLSIDDGPGRMTNTKRGRQYLVNLARTELGFPFTLKATTESGEPRSWLIQTPTDARVFVNSASNKMHWRV